MDVILDNRINLQKDDTITLERDVLLRPVNSKQQKIAGILFVEDPKVNKWIFDREISIEDFDIATIKGKELYLNRKYSKMRAIFLLTSICDYNEMISRPRFLLSYNQSETILFSIRIPTLFISIIIIVGIIMLAKRYQKHHSLE